MVLSPYATRRFPEPLNNYNRMPRMRVLISRLAPTLIGAVEKEVHYELHVVSARPHGARGLVG